MTDRTSTKAKFPWWMKTLVLASLPVLLFVVVAGVLFHQSEPVAEKELEAPEEFSFNGASTDLRQTILVPTLNSPLPADKSVLWCATLPLAWQQLEKEVAKASLELEGAAELSRSLSQAPDPGLRTKDYYVAAGRYQEGILDRIRRELPVKFPQAPLPPAEAPADGSALAYAYLEVDIKYAYHFKHSAEPLHFHDAQGRMTSVHAFGIREKDKNDGADSFRSQVEVLFRQKGEYAIDLSRPTRPYQIILARMDRQLTLQATLADLEQRLDQAKKQAVKPTLGDAAVLLVPSMHWSIDHRCAELERRPFVTSPLRGQWLDTVRQHIRFKMDRKGTFVASGVNMGVMMNGHEKDDDPNNYRFDRPYLIVMRKRGLLQPFFVMWVDNAELMQKR